MDAGRTARTDGDEDVRRRVATARADGGEDAWRRRGRATARRSERKKSKGEDGKDGRRRGQKVATRAATARMGSGKREQQSPPPSLLASTPPKKVAPAKNRNCKAVSKGMSHVARLFGHLPADPFP